MISRLFNAYGWVFDILEPLSSISGIMLESGKTETLNRWLARERR